MKIAISKLFLLKWITLSSCSNNFRRLNAAMLLFLFSSMLVVGNKIASEDIILPKKAVGDYDLVQEKPKFI